MVSKLDLAAIVAAVACAALWVEHRHHVFTDVPTPTELSTPATAAACPDNDNVPYPASCLVFMGDAFVSDMRSQANTPVRAPLAKVPRRTDAPLRTSAAACAVNDNVPYSESCITFMSGWRWQPM